MAELIFFFVGHFDYKGSVVWIGSNISGIIVRIVGRVHVDRDSAVGRYDVVMHADACFF